MELYKRVVILAPKSMSKSARALKNELAPHINMPIILVSPNSKTYQGRWSDYVINWGYSKRPEFLHVDNNNDYWNIDTAVNKLETFIFLTKAGVPTVEWCVELKQATEWWEKGNLVVGRKTATGFGGKDITLFGPDEEPVEGYALYTKYKKKKNEYRVHVFDKEVIDITQKKKKKGNPNVETKIRNYHNGWVYCRSDIHIPADLTKLAIRAVEVLCLRHGAVDIIWNEKENKCYVLEINTAPGLVGTTLEKYTQAFIKDFN